jgi:hypothetical protein
VQPSDTELPLSHFSHLHISEQWMLVDFLNVVHIRKAVPILAKFTKIPPASIQSIASAAPSFSACILPPQCTPVALLWEAVGSWNWWESHRW